jgi:SAM-dependent methyltransferase
VDRARRPPASARSRRAPRGASDPFAELAPLYDLDVEGHDEDIELYTALAARASRGGRPARVLGRGSGTGRVASALAAAGHSVVAVDASASMLAQCRERCAGLPVRCVRGDMRTLDLGERFRLVLVPLGGLEHMESAEELTQALATVARHLAPGGLAVVDVAAPQPEDLALGAQPLVEHWTRDLPGAGGAPGARVTKLVSLEAQPAESLRQVTWHFDVQPAEGALRRVTVRFPLRMITAGEIELAAALAELRVTGWHGDYTLSPLDDGAVRIIATLRRARRRRSR